jgi:DNA-binding LytR/AlgR family response regulator
MEKESFEKIITMINEGCTFYFTTAYKSYIVNKKNIKSLSHKGNCIYVNKLDVSYTKITYTR